MNEKNNKGTFKELEEKQLATINGGQSGNFSEAVVDIVRDIISSVGSKSK